MTVAELDLVTVYCDGDTDLISLAVGKVLAYGVGSVIDGTPHFDMARDAEDDIWEFIHPGEGYTSEDDGYPGTENVIAYLKANRHLLT
jgi:hypothetical protein